MFNILQNNLTSDERLYTMQLSVIDTYKTNKVSHRNFPSAIRTKLF